MTGAHLLFAIMTTAYIAAAIRWEENDLLVAHGERYAHYRESVPMLVPSKPGYQAAAQEYSVSRIA
jgi:protein-S-isoprenylcysteine O-methyltransferase Ste14